MRHNTLPEAASRQDSVLLDPERNIQIGCWYLEKSREKYRGFPAEDAMTLAAYNAGASRAQRWAGGDDTTGVTTPQFLRKIDFPGTRKYVESIIARYQFYKRRGHL